MQNLFAVCHSMCTYVEGPKNLKMLGFRPLGGGGADLLETRTSPHVLPCLIWLF